MLRLPTLAALTGLAVLLGAAPARACVCAPSPPAQERDAADAVFRGRVLAVERAEPPPRERVRLQVLAVYKGRLGPEVEVDPQTHTSCGYTFAPGAEYLVVAQRSQEGGGPPYVVTRCSRTQPFREDAPFLSELGAPRPPEPAGPGAAPGDAPGEEQGASSPALQLLLVLAVAFATAWLGVSINLDTRRQATRGTKLRILARRRRRR